MTQDQKIQAETILDRNGFVPYNRKSKLRKIVRNLKSRGKA